MAITQKEIGPNENAMLPLVRHGVTFVPDFCRQS